MRFKDREDAGRQLAIALEQLELRQPLVVYALPRGGVELGAAIARQLDAPLSLVIPRKIGHPYHPEYAIAAVTEGGGIVTNPAEVGDIDEEWLETEVEHQKQEARRRRSLYLHGKPSLSGKGKTAIIVDDGVATGLTLVAALKELALQKPARIIVAVPVIPLDIAESLETEVDGVVVLKKPMHFAGSVGSYYDYFPQVEDNEVVNLLEETNDGRSKPETS